MSNDVDAAIAAAKNKSNEVVESQSQSQAVTTHTAAPAPAPMTLDDLTNSGMSVEDWLKVDKAGLSVGAEPTSYFEELEVIIHTSQIVPCESIKYGNQPPVYKKTYDRINCAEGGTWQEAVARAQQVDQGARPYPSAEIPMEVVSDVKGKGDKVVAKAGDVLGHAPSTTGYKNFSAMMKQIKEDKGSVEGQKVKVKIGYKVLSNKNQQTWGVLTYDIIEYIED